MEEIEVVVDTPLKPAPLAQATMIEGKSSAGERKTGGGGGGRGKADDGPAENGGAAEGKGGGGGEGKDVEAGDDEDVEESNALDDPRLEHEVQRRVAEEMRRLEGELEVLRAGQAELAGGQSKK